MAETTLFPAAALDGTHAVGARMPDAAGVVWEHEGNGMWKAPATGRRCEIGHEDARTTEVRELQIPRDSRIVAEVVGAVLSFPELYPTLTGWEPADDD